jgi:predicted DNA-binding transcriptional regulator YafY
VYQPTSRLLTVLELLQARPAISGAELARRLEVDRRTVRRYVMTLQDIGIPVESVRGRHGGYRLRPGFKLPPLMFTEDEAVAVTLGLIAARRSGLAAAAQATEGALAKVERVLPERVSARIRSLQESVAFTERGPTPHPPSGETLLTMSEAARRRRRVWMRYRSAHGSGRESEREVDPYGLVFHGGNWYVVGHDHQSGQTRTFRADRVLAVESRGETFEPSGVDAAEHLQRALATWPWGEAIEVVLETTMARARRAVAPHTATLDEIEGGVLLRFQADDAGAAARYLISLGLPFVVRHPERLREALRRLADELIATAER